MLCRQESEVISFIDQTIFLGASASAIEDEIHE
jgi:hypothetical protein